MVVRKAAGTLTKQEKSIVKTLLQKGWRNQDIQALLNIHRKATVMQCSRKKSHLRQALPP